MGDEESGKGFYLPKFSYSSTGTRIKTEYASQ